MELNEFDVAILQTNDVGPYCSRVKHIVITICLALVLFGSTLVGSPAGAAPPDFTETDCEGVSDSIFRLYSAALGREAEEGGYDFWLTEYQEGRFGLVRAANFFVTSDEFRATYGSLTNEGFVEQLYLNVLGRPGEPSGVAFWTSELDTGSRSRSLVLLDFSESPENVTNTETQTPSLGFFNRGLDGPWTCGVQPATNSCVFSDGGLAGPRLDYTVEIPEVVGGPEARAAIGVDIFRGGVFDGTWIFNVRGAIAGDRVSDVTTIPGLREPVSDLTCSIRSVNANGREAPEGLDGATCEFAGSQTEFGIESMLVAVSVPKPPDQAALGNAIVELRVDGFRVDESPVSLNPPSAGADGAGMTSFLLDLIPEGIDSRRVHCNLVEVSWLDL